MSGPGEEREGMAAEVGVRKLNEDDEVVQEEGFMDEDHPTWAYVIVVLLIVFSLFGVWKALELLAGLVL